MSSLPVVAIFDIGRTNKKFVLFGKDYNVIKEEWIEIPDIEDDDGCPCEDLRAITKWMMDHLYSLLSQSELDLKAVNFSGHGAALVHINEKGNPVAPLYDYLKPLAGKLCAEFYDLFGGKSSFSVATGSPALNMLNSGIQLFWLKKERQGVLKQITTSLHLPQYFNFLLTGKKHAEMTSIGCHTGLWDIKKQRYHVWLQNEKLSGFLPLAERINTYDEVKFGEKVLSVGIGIHDSSAALLPFMHNAQEDFILLSTGTWNITLNPFFTGNLENRDYARDCLYYFTDVKCRVASSRLFLGNEYEQAINQLEHFFQKKHGYHQEVTPDKKILNNLLNHQSEQVVFYPQTMHGTGPYPDLDRPSPDLSQFDSFETAYHKLMLDMGWLQKVSTGLVSEKIKRIYVTGGFILNSLFMELLQAFFWDWKIFIAENKRTSALGAAVVLHDVWHEKPFSLSIAPVSLFESKFHLDVHEYKDFFGA